MCKTTFLRFCELPLLVTQWLVTKKLLQQQKTKLLAGRSARHTHTVHNVRMAVPPKSVAKSFHEYVQRESEESETRKHPLKI